MPDVVAGLASVFAAFGASAATATMLAISTLFSAAMMAVTAVARAIIGGPKIPDITHDLQTRQVALRQPISPWVVAYGDSRIGGIVVFITLTGGSKEYLHLVVVHASGECEGIQGLQFDGVEVPLDGVGDAIGTYAGHVHMDSRIGSTDPAVQTAYAGLIADTGGVWTDNDRGFGHCHSWLRLKWNADLFPNGLPKLTWRIKGRKVVDPRTGTKAYSNNFALCVRDYMLDTDVGVVATSSELDDVANIAGANLSDEDVALRAGGNEKRYTMNGSFACDKPPAEVLPSLLTAGWGQAICSAGKWGIYPAAWRGPGSLETLSENDFRAPVRYEARLRRSEIFNGVKGVFLCPEKQWQPDDFPPFSLSSDRGYASDPYLTEDGERLWKDVTLPFTSSPATAQRLAKIVLIQARNQGTLRAPCKLKAFQYQPGDTCPVSFAPFGWSGKYFSVGEWRWVPEQTNDENGVTAVSYGVDMVLRETASSCYAWSTTDELPLGGGAGIASPPALPDVSDVAEPTGLALLSDDSTTITRVDGVKISRLRVSWTSPNDAFVKSGGAILIQYKLHTDSNWTAFGQVDGADTIAYIMDVVDGVGYDVRICAVNSAGTASDWVEADNCIIQGAAFPHTTYRPLSNPLTARDGGSFPVVDIASFVMRIAGVKDVTLAPGAVNGSAGDYGKTAYLFYEDSALVGGTRPFNVTFTRETALSGTCRFFVGSVPFPEQGGPVTVGNNDGGAGAQLGRSAQLWPTSAVGSGWSNPSYVLDLVPDNYASCSSSTPASIEIAGFPAYSNWFTDVDLAVRHQLTGGSAILEYSKDDGANWAVIRSVSSPDADPVTSMVVLPATVKTDKVRARMTMSPGGTSSQNYAGTAANQSRSETPWTSPSQATGAPNGGGAACENSASINAESDYLKLTNFGFAIPGGATITGIVVDVTRMAAIGFGDGVAFARDLSLALVVGGSIVGERADGLNSWPVSFGAKSYGGVTDMFGQSLTPTLVNSSNFGVALAVELLANGGPTITAYVDSVRVTIYYGTGGASSGRLYAVTQEVQL